MPQPEPTSKGDMIEVVKEDANNYCRILRLLGMEEEGDPVAEVQRLVDASQQREPQEAAERPANFTELWELYSRVGDAHENHGRNHEKTMEARATFHAALMRALSAPQEASKVEPVADEAVYWEYRHLDSANPPNRWSEWEICKPRNVHMNTAEDFKNEIQGYIDRGYRYELRALYLRPTQQALSDEDLDLLWLEHRPPGVSNEEQYRCARKFARAILAASSGSKP